MTSHFSASCSASACPSAFFQASLGRQSYTNWPCGAVREYLGDILFPGMYARKLKVEIMVGGERRPCPLDWLDSFCMRNFTGAAEFDDTLPTGDGALEASFRVDPERLAAALAAWLTQRGKGNGQPVHVEIHAALKPG